MISLIAAIQSKDGGIGFQNELLFRISDDLKRFKALTIGHPIIMGRKTFESIGANPLPNRTNIVITRRERVQEGVIFCHSMEDALDTARAHDDNIFIIGGAEIYTQTLPIASRLELTIVESNVPADTFFHEYSQFTKVVNEEKRVDEKTGLGYVWVTLEKP